MNIKAIILFALLTAVGGFAQLPNEGPIKTFDISALMQGNIEQYKGLKFIYYNVIQYDGNVYKPPFPYSEGRERSGKYKASQTAMDNYLKSLSKYNGKAFSVVSVVPGEMNIPQVVLACENGDTLIFQSTFIISEFVSKKYIDDEKKKIGSKFYLGDASMMGAVAKQNPTNQMLYAYFYGFKNEKTGKTIFYLPYLSEWKITNVSYDTTYIGQRNMMNNSMNFNGIFDRIMYTIENPNYGKYKCFLNNGRDLIIKDLKNIEHLYTTTPTSPEDIALINEWASKNYIEAVYLKEKINQKNEESNISPKIIELAKKGYLPAVEQYVSQNATTIYMTKFKSLKKTIPDDVQRQLKVSNELIKDYQDKIELVEKMAKKYGKIQLIGQLYNSVASAYESMGPNLASTPEARVDYYKQAMELYQKALDCGYEYAKNAHKHAKEMWEANKENLEKFSKEEEKANAKAEEVAKHPEIIQQEERKKSFEKMKQRVKEFQTSELLKKAESMEKSLNIYRCSTNPSDICTTLEETLNIIKAELKTRKK